MHSLPLKISVATMPTMVEIPMKKINVPTIRAQNLKLLR
jgi:hypothetical protein